MRHLETWEICLELVFLYIYTSSISSDCKLVIVAQLFRKLNFSSMIAHSKHFLYFEYLSRSVCNSSALCVCACAHVYVCVIISM